MPLRKLAAEIAAATRDLRPEVGSAHTMDKALDLALELVGGAQEATISLAMRDGNVETAATTGEAAQHLDELQYKHGEGPCLDAIRQRETVHSSDIVQDERWPAWGPAAQEATGARSILCLHLFTNDDSIGALNFFSRQTDAFDESDCENGLAIAALAASAVTTAREIEHLKLAMDSRNLIGQAQGIIMASYDVDAHTAFAVLTRLSSHSNRKLREVAADVATLRQLPPQPEA